MGTWDKNDSSKKHTGDFFIVESVCLLCTFDAQVPSMPSAIDSTQALLSNTLQAASIPGASPAMHLGWQDDWDPAFFGSIEKGTTS